MDRGSSAALFLNSANYLMGDFSLVSIRDREFVYREWNLDANEFNFRPVLDLAAVAGAYGDHGGRGLVGSALARRSHQLPDGAPVAPVLDGVITRP